MKRTHQDWLTIAAEQLQSRTWTVKKISKKENMTLYKLGCFVCDKQNEKIYEVICDGGEPFWFGTSCAKKLKEQTGIDLSIPTKNG